MGVVGQHPEISSKSIRPTDPWSKPSGSSTNLSFSSAPWTNDLATSNNMNERIAAERGSAAPVRNAFSRVSSAEFTIKRRSPSNGPSRPSGFHSNAHAAPSGKRANAREINRRDREASRSSFEGYARVVDPKHRPFAFGRDWAGACSGVSENNCGLQIEAASGCRSGHDQ